MRRSLLQALVLAIPVLIPRLCKASVATVPDDYSTVQAAIDIGSDTVLVREGDYPEVLQAYRGVVLLGFGPRRPQLAGLVISNPYSELSRQWRIVGIDFVGPVFIQTPNFTARLLDIAFANSHLQGGLLHDHLGGSDQYDIRTLALAHCRLGAASEGRSAHLQMYSDTLDAGISWGVVESVTVDSCRFDGGSLEALHLWGRELFGRIEGNTFTGAFKGIYVPGSTELIVRNNTIQRMSGIGIEVGGWKALIADNRVSDCGIGIWCRVNEATIRDNTILRTANTGLHLDQPDMISARGNVIGVCGGSATYVEYAFLADLQFVENTFFSAGGSGLLLGAGSSNTLLMESNIGFGNAAFGLQVSTMGFTGTLRCNDWYGNTLGGVHGVPWSPLDVNVDPGFCDVSVGDVRLYSDSQLLGRGECAQIGARGVGCSPPALKAMNVASNRAGLGLEWELESASPVETWIERADQAAGPWDSLGTGTPNVTGGCEFLDASVAPDRAYHYRVAWRDRGVVVRGSPVMGIWVDAGRRSSVTPNPASTELKVEWVLAQPGRTDIRIFDLAGREVAVVAKGTYSVGRHREQWNGHWQAHGPAPAGMYIVRIASADRTTTHRVLLVR